MIAALAEFALRWLLCCAGLFLLLGMLPLSARPAAAQRSGATLLVLVDLILLPLVALAAIRRAVATAPWPGVVVIGGLLLLAGPFLLQPFPRSIREGRGGLTLLLVLCLVALLV